MKWKRQISVGVNATMRDSKPLKSDNYKKLEAENRRLKGIVLNQAVELADLKKELNLD